jgi:outer membrane lipopolysaccharide assembly protein LptE/RlpB
MKITSKLKIFLALLLLLSMQGCGYSFQGSSTILPPDVKRIYIPLVENNSTESGLTTLFTDALKDQFEKYGVVRIVDDVAEADAVLRARILKVQRSTGAVSGESDSAIQLDTTMYLSAELRRSTGTVLWKDPNLQVSQTYGAVDELVVTSSADFASSGVGLSDLAALGQSGNREIQRGQEKNVLKQIAIEAASKIYDASVAADF